MGRGQFLILSRASALSLGWQVNLFRENTVCPCHFHRDNCAPRCYEPAAALTTPRWPPSWWDTSASTLPSCYGRGSARHTIITTCDLTADLNALERRGRCVGDRKEARGGSHAIGGLHRSIGVRYRKGSIAIREQHYISLLLLIRTAGFITHRQFPLAATIGPGPHCVASCGEFGVRLQASTSCCWTSVSRGTRFARLHERG